MQASVRFVPVHQAIVCSCKRRPMTGVVHIIHNAATAMLTLYSYRVIIVRFLRGKRKGHTTVGQEEPEGE
jgi:hypothetical protein